MADDVKVGPGGEPKERKTSDRSLTWVWMVVSLLVVGGFLVWLGMASEPTAVVVAEDEDTAAASDTIGAGAAGATPVPKDTLAENKAAYEGQVIQVSKIEATSPLGPRIFWGELGTRENQVPILVRLDSAAAEGWQLQQGAQYTITGELQRMTDSVATAWGEQGEFTGEGEQMQATFTDYFIQASRIRPSRGARTTEPSGNGDGGAGAGNGG